MKKQILCLLLIAVAICACNKDELVIPKLSIPKTQYNITAAGGKIEVYLQTDAALEVNIKDAQWVQQLQTKALTLDYMCFICDPNKTMTERTSEITISSVDKLVTQTITITQEANSEQPPRINSFAFLVKDNKDKILADVIADIDTNGNIVARIPYILTNKQLVPTITFDGKEIKVQTPFENQIDFTAPVVYQVSNDIGTTKEYIVYTHSFTGLPVVTIETEQRYIDPKKEVYVKGSVKIDGSTNFPKNFEATTRLKGRGNATWFYPKKPYRLKLDEKASLLGMPEDKDWVLLAGYCDMSLIRLDLFFEIGKALEMEWTPRMEFVELFLNGRYEGNYMLGEHVKTANRRLNVNEVDGGMLIEEDGYYTSEPKWFTSSVMNLGYSFKTPDPDDITNEQIAYSKSVIDDFETRLYSADFKDPVKGYKAVIDINNFAAWWLTQNVCRNMDTNRYLYKMDKDSKLCIGPLWDAEWSFGIGVHNGANWVNLPCPIDGLINHPYFIKMMQDEAFLAAVKNLWANKKETIKNAVIDKTNQNYKHLLLSQEANYARWNTLSDFTSVGYVALTTFNNEIQYVKDYFLKRYNWLDSEINKF